MRVIFLKDVARVGKRDDVREVADGYALNFLIPHGFAMQATPEKVAALAARVASARKAGQTHASEMAALLKKLHGTRITLKARSNDQGHLFKGVNGDDIAKRISEEMSLAIDPDIVSTDPIKRLGAHTVKLSSGGIEALVTIVVERDEDR